MARKLDIPPQNIAAWKRVGRIPSDKQPHVLKVALSLGLAVTAHDIIFPLGSDASSATDGSATIGNATPLTEGPEVGQ